MSHKFSHKAIGIVLAIISVSTISFADDYNYERELNYNIERQITIGNGNNPLWLNANKFGLSSIKDDNGYLRAGISGIEPLGNAQEWHFNYGIDVAAAYNFTSSFIIQQLYGELQYKKIVISVGSKERPANLKNNELSSGSQTFGINARPIPEISIGTSDYFNILRNSNLLGLKFHFGYGVTTDWRWQKHFVNTGERYTGKTLSHTQSGFLRIGNEKKFPLVFEGGLEWGCIFGGTSYNLDYGNIKEVTMNHGIKQFIEAIYGGGSDPTDAGYNNAQGNTLGSLLFSLSYKLNDAKIRLYLDHFFEDHSQMFFEYGWKDGLYGCEITLPKNRIASSLVYEYVRTDNQSGPIYHDATQAIPDQISAADNYYNHTIYTGWQHWGQAIGNPLYTAPLYNSNGKIVFANNRLRAHHIGICGDPLNSLHYKLLYSYSTNYGTYDAPLDSKMYNNSFLAEVTYSPKNIGTWNLEGNSIRLGFGFDRGELLGNNTGFQLTICSKGLFNL